MLKRIAERAEKVAEKYGPFVSDHEIYAVLKEELDELWDSIKAGEPDKNEAFDIAVAAYRAYTQDNIINGINADHKLKFGYNFKSEHDAYAQLLARCDFYWESVKADSSEDMWLYHICDIAGSIYKMLEAEDVVI